MDAKDRRGLSDLVLLVGLYQGLLPFVAQVFGWHPVLSLPSRLDGPAWWLVSAAVVVVCAGLLEALHRAGDTRRGRP